MLKPYLIISPLGCRTWQAEDIEHAKEQHNDAFPDEKILWVERK